MTETEKRFFSVDVSNDIHIVNLHETLEQAKQSCLAGAVEAHEFTDDMCDHEDFASNDLPYAVYGIIIGKAECKEKQLSEEEKEDYGSDLVLEKPEIVEFPQDDGWISVKDRLPEPDDANAVMFWKGASHLVYGKPISGKGCGEKDIYFGFYLKNPSNNEDIWAWGWHKNSDGKIVFDEIEATHWRSLPPIPKTE
ncbi:TPA: DUF551 domain-containing protein [Pasteurella multocida]|nr:DUF551 domain-containing protein [Pasteurella multocida]HDR1841746.1 DUF551 domain-containing protein [Pasteurella multocida]